MSDTRASRDPFLPLLETRRAAGLDREPEWLRRIREEAADRYARLGLPSPRQEEWKYTNLAPLARSSYERTGPGEAGDPRSPERPEIEGAIRLVLVNGGFRPDLSSPRDGHDAVCVEALGAVDAVPDAFRSDQAIVSEIFSRRLGGLGEEHSLAALNTALFEAGVFVRVRRSSGPAPTLHLVFIAGGGGAATADFPRVLVRVEEGAEATLVEEFPSLGGDPGLTVAVTECDVAARGRLRHCRLCHGRSERSRVTVLGVAQHEGSTFRSTSVDLAGLLVRNDVDVSLDGEGCECRLDGVVVAGDATHVDNHTRIAHARPHCVSHEDYKTVLADRATGVFNGKILVEEGAQKTDARQSNQTLLLSDTATMSSKPELEIYADDVKCTHGATVGQLDAASLFYLRSRGIDLEAARAILTHAFAGRIVGRLPSGPIARAVELRLGEALDQRIRRRARLDPQRQSPPT